MAKKSDSAPKIDFQAQLPPDWREVLTAEFEQPYMPKLEEFVAKERAEHKVYPPQDEVFSAFRLTPYENVKALLLGQDPYHGEGQAHGLCFSVKPGVRVPASLVNIFKELNDDLGCKVPNNGYLVPWAEQGMLMINAVLTVQAGKPNSHANHGWEKFTDAVIRAVSAKDDGVVFILWGAYAQKKEKLIDTSKHRVVKAAHPSPLSMKKFLGSGVFTEVDEALEALGHEPMDWQIPDL